MNINRRTFTKSLFGAAGSLAAGSWFLQNRPAWSRMPVALAQAANRLSPTRVTKIRVFFPPNWDRNGAQALPQSNVVVLVDTEAGITGVGQGGSPDTLRNVSRSVIGKNAFDTEMIWQAAFMDAHYSPGDERLHALGAIDLALWDIKGKALGVPLYQLFGGKAREHIELYATSGLPQGVVPPEEAQTDGPEGTRSGDDGRRMARVSRRQRHPAEHRWRSDRWTGPGSRRGRCPWSGSRWCGRSSRRPRRGPWWRTGRRAGRIPVQHTCAHSTDHQSARADPRGRWTRRRLHDRPASEVRPS